MEEAAPQKLILTDKIQRIRLTGKMEMATADNIPRITLIQKMMKQIQNVQNKKTL